MLHPLAVPLPLPHYAPIAHQAQEVIGVGRRRSVAPHVQRRRHGAGEGAGESQRMGHYARAVEGLPEPRRLRIGLRKVAIVLFPMRGGQCVG